MNETQKRIQAYKAALPGLRERVVAVALLLAMSVAMLTSASFAWLTISQAPEVSGVSTTVAANGNLEIALAGGDGKTAPGESAVGDSAAADDQTLAEANLTWGNLVNLSDPVYGLSNMALRPALLSDYNLNKYPLYGASYGDDGRVVATTARYEYATWATAADGTKYFAAGDKMTHGVRAIASVTYQNITGNAVFTELWEDAEEAYGNSRTGYINLLTDVTPIQDHAGVSSKATTALGGLLSIYTQDLVNTYLNDSPSDSDCSAYVVPLRNMMLEFKSILQDEGEALMHLANLQAYMHDNAVGTETYKSWEELYAAPNSELEAKGITLVSLTDTNVGLRTDWRVLLEQITAIEQLMVDKGFYNEDGSFKTSLPVVKWSEFEGILNNIVHIDSTEMDGTPIGSVNSSNVSSFASSVLGGNPDVVIKRGILRNLEQRTGTRMADPDTMGKSISVTVRVKVLITMNVTATVTTDAAPTYASVTDKMYAEELNNSAQGGDAVGEDTYGMAIDLWVRTNTDDVVLTLEGSTIYKEERATGVDVNGRTTNLFILNTEEGDVDIYKLDDKWYYANNHQEVDSSLMTDFDENDEENWKMNQIVVGYEGENRIWEDWQAMLEAGLIEEDNTTQGAGSCFIFYADGPSDQARILDLLNAFTVAFVDGEGNRLGTAMLAIDRAYAINGKVTVPLEIVNGTEYKDEFNADQMGITALKKNESTRISAIVYLNGMRLENENVLAEGSIEGNLNLQFGSSVSLTSPENEALQTEYRTITAVATTSAAVAEGDQTSASQSDPIKFTYDRTAKPVSVALTVDGVQPEKITGFFVRTISTTQGSRGDTVDFEQNEDGTWTGSFDLSTPGTYVLRSLMVDGVEYTLDACPAVSISGLDYTISCDLEPGLHMTADKSVDVKVTAKINADTTLMPGQVRAQFRSADGSEHNALMSYDAANEQWVGTATINSSGTYTLEYLVMDGEYFLLDENDQITLILSLGMVTRVYSDHASEFTYEGEDITIPVKARVWDDTNTEIKNLDGVKLYYHVSGSALDQNGLASEMNWNATSGYYEGNFNVTTPGIYSFDRLQVTNVSGGGSSTIRSASSAPVFTAISLDPPAYEGYLPNEYQFAPTDADNTNDAKLSIEMANASAASIWGRIVQNGGTEYLVKGQNVSSKQVTVDDKIVTINGFDFVIPKDQNLLDGDTGQDGEWVLTDIYLQGVYVADEDLTDGEDSSKMYYSTEPAPTTVADVTGENSDDFYRISVADEGGDKGIYAYVVSTVNASIRQDGELYEGNDFGVDENGTRTSYFMDPHTVSGITIHVTDWNNRAIEGLTSVTWDVTYQANTSSQYGGYTGADPAPYEVELADDGTHTVFTAADQTFRYAGVYNTAITIQSGDLVYNVPNAPRITVSSIKPHVQFTATDPAANSSFTGFDNTFEDTQSRTNTITNNNHTVTLYLRSSTRTCSTSTYATPSRATTGLYNAGTNFTSATLVFDGADYDVTFTYSPAADTATAAYNTQSFGSSSGSGNSMTKTMPGLNVQTNQLVLVYNNLEYTVTLTDTLTANALY